MCDDKTLEDNERFLASTGRLSRRHFGALSGAAAMSAMVPAPAHAAEVIESDIDVATPDGAADCYFVRPASGAHAGVLLWTDILGPRPSFRAMGKRLAQSGYSVLLVNPFYREERAPVVPEGATFGDPDVRAKVIGLAQKLTPETTVTDATAFVSFLDSEESVDTGRKIGTMGYCMSGSMAIRTAAAIPDRVGAAASFHGGGLVTDSETSPHLLIPKTKASFLIAIAENDDEKEPDAKDVLRQTADEAGIAAEIEVYEGALHGWCPPDSPIYNEAQAERAWSRLLALFETTLA
ncbi:MAG: dienelactone hydrolase family protein [Pseudomonadota bacterium]